MDADVEAPRLSVTKGRPSAREDWQRRVARLLGLDHRPRGPVLILLLLPDHPPSRGPGLRTPGTAPAAVPRALRRCAGAHRPTPMRPVVPVVPARLAARTLRLRLGRPLGERGGLPLVARAGVSSFASRASGSAILRSREAQPGQPCPLARLFPSAPMPGT